MGDVSGETAVCVFVCVCVGGAIKLMGFEHWATESTTEGGEEKKVVAKQEIPKPPPPKAPTYSGDPIVPGHGGNGPRMEKGNTQKGRAPKAKAHREVQKGMIANERMQKGRIAKEKIANERGRKGKIPREQKKAWR